MATIKEKITINAPVDKVFGFMTSPDNWTKYVTSLTSVSDFSSAGLEPGTTFTWEYRMLGVKLSGSGTVSDNSKNAVFGMKMTGAVPMSEYYTFTPSAGDTELAVEITYELPGKVLEKIANSRIVEKLNQREAINVLEKIKLLCEDL
jgi:coenzyme Q-binding protein COQ10